MRRLKTEVLIIGNGSAAILAANRFVGQGASVVLVNPMPEFGIEDLRPRTGLSLWNAAYRSDNPNVSLSDLYETLESRLREVFPATVAQSGLRRCEHWSVLSTTPIHRAATDDLEREFFRLERKPWSAPHIRLVNPEHVLARTRRLGLDLPVVAQLEGAVIRNNGITWDAARMGMYLCQFVRNRFSEQSPTELCFTDVTIKGRYGRKVVITATDGEEVSIESESVVIFLTGELLPHIKSIVAACDEPWIQGTRKRRREQHFVWFERPQKKDQPKASEEDLWLDLGSTRYMWSQAGGSATWTSQRGPDGLERVIDEGLRLQSLPRPNTRFTQAQRAFRLEWEWRTPQWRETSHHAYWATCFEGDLYGITELLWNLPHH